MITLVPLAIPLMFTGFHQEPLNDAKLKTAVGLGLNSMDAPCSYRVEYRMYSAGPGTEAFLAIQSFLSNPAGFHQESTLEFRQALGLGSKVIPGLTEESALMRFDFDHGHHQDKQVGLAPNDICAFVQSRNREVAYFPQEQRLELQLPTKNTAIMRPATVYGSLPIISQDVRSLQEQPWKITDQPERGLITVEAPYGAGGDRFGISLGGDEAHLPYACWITHPTEKRIRAYTLLRWSSFETGAHVAEVFDVIELTQRIDVVHSLLPRFDWTTERDEPDLMVPKGTAVYVNDGETRKRLGVIEAPPSEWQGLWRFEQGDK